MADILELSVFIEFRLPDALQPFSFWYATKRLHIDHDKKSYRQNNYTRNNPVNHLYEINIKCIDFCLYMKVYSILLHFLTKFIMYF